MPSPIRFYFDFVSAYSYIAMNRIDKVAARYGRIVDWNVVELPEILSYHKDTAPRDKPAKFANNQNSNPNNRN